MSNRRITNAQKYKTIDERVRAFWDFCDRKHDCKKCELNNGCRSEVECILRWLELKASIEPMNCPYCKSPCTVENVCTNEDQTSKYVCCTNEDCMYQSANAKSENEAVIAHNRICEAVLIAHGRNNKKRKGTK